MYTQFQRFTATILLFSILLQSCGNPNFKRLNEEAPKPGVQSGNFDEYRKEKSSSVLAIPTSPSEVLANVSSREQHGDQLSTTKPMPVRSTVVPVSPQPTSAIKLSLTPTLPLSNTSTEPRTNKPEQMVLSKSIDKYALRKDLPAPAAGIPARAHLAPQADPIVQRSQPLSMSFVAPGSLSEQTYAIAQGHQVRFQETSGSWLAYVEDVWGRSQVLPVICAPDRVLSSVIGQLASKVPSQHKYWVHVLETDQAPWAPRVVYVGVLGLRGGGSEILKQFAKTIAIPFDSRPLAPLVQAVNEICIQLGKCSLCTDHLKASIQKGKEVMHLLEQQRYTTNLDFNECVLRKTLEDKLSCHVRLSQCLQEWSQSFTDTERIVFEDTIVPLLKQSFLRANIKVQQEMLAYWEDEGHCYTDLLKNAAVEDWLGQSLFSDIVQEALASSNMLLYDQFMQAVGCLVQHKEGPAQNKLLNQLLWLLRARKQAHRLDLFTLCNLMAWLPTDGEKARQLLNNEAPDWYYVLKDHWIRPRLAAFQDHCPTEDITAIGDILVRLPWDKTLTDSFLFAVASEKDASAFKQCLLFLEKYPITDDLLLEKFHTVLPEGVANPCVVLHHTLACDLLKASISKLFDQQADVLYEQISAMLRHNLGAYDAFHTLLTTLQATDMTLQERNEQALQLREVLALLSDYGATTEIFAEALKSITEQSASQWEKTTHQHVVAATFHDSYELSEQEIIERMSQNALDVFFVGDTQKLQNSYDDVLLAYQSHSLVLDHQEPIASWSSSTITEWGHRIRSKEQHTSPTQSELLAVVKRAVELHHGFSPRATQLLSVLALLNTPEDKGRLAQINTGEGKSLIVAMLAALHALRGQKVDVLTTSEELSIPEVRKQMPFFTALGLTVAENSKKNALDDEARHAIYQQDVVYGTAESFQADIINTEFFRRNIRGNRGFGVVLVDEVDSMLFDDRNYSTQLSSLTPAMNHLEIVLGATWNLVNQIASRLRTIDGQCYFIKAEKFKDVTDGVILPEGQTLDSCSELIEDQVAFLRKYTTAHLETILRKLTPEDLKKLSAYRAQELLIEQLRERDIHDEARQKSEIETALQILKQEPWSQEEAYLELPAHLQDFARTQIPNWVESAICALLFYKKDQHYYVNGGKIVPIDYSNTGVLQHNTVWNNGLAQFLQIKEGLKVIPEDVSTNFISKPGYFKRYEGRLYGLTGTLGNATTRSFLTAMYGVDTVIIPPYKQREILGNGASCYLCKELSPRLTTTIQAWHDAIIESVLRPARNGQAVLVICNYMSQVHHLKEQLAAKYDANKLFAYTGEVDFTKHQVDTGEIILATNIAGRGTDLTTSGAVEDHGGLHVCITFLPASYRVELQNAGRTARQGKKGSAQLILRTSDGETLPDLRAQRDEKEEKAIERARRDVGRMLASDLLFMRYCGLEASFFPTMEEVAKMKMSRDLWAAWQLQSEKILSSEALSASYEQHIQQRTQIVLQRVTEPASWCNYTTEQLLEARNRLKQASRARCMQEESFEKYCVTYKRKIQEGYVHSYEKNLKQAIPADVSVAFLEGRVYMPLDSDLARKYGWEEYERRGSQERWGIWLKEDSREKDIDDAARRHRFDGFATELVADAQADKLIKNPTYYVEKGNDYLRRRYINSSVKAYNKAIALDPLYSVNARFNKARALLSSKENKHNHAEAKKELTQAKYLIRIHHKSSLLSFDTLVGQTGQKPRISEHVQHHLDILSQQENYIQAAIDVIERAQKENWDVEITEIKTLEKVFSEAEGDRSQAFKEAKCNGLTHVFTIREKEPKKWLSICAVALIGLAQITAAVLLSTYTLGASWSVTKGLIAEGISDLITAVMSGIRGGFSWADWGLQKAISLAVSLISSGQATIKKGCQAVKEVAQNLGRVATDVGKKGMKTVIRSVGWDLSRSVASKCATVLVDYGVGQTLVKNIEEAIHKAIAEKIIRSLEKSTLIQAAIALDVKNENNYWQNLLRNEGLDLLAAKKDNKVLYALKEIAKGVASNKIKGAKAVLESVAMAKALQEVLTITDDFLSGFHEGLEKKYKKEIQAAEGKHQQKAIQQQEQEEEKQQVSQQVSPPPLVDEEDVEVARVTMQEDYKSELRTYYYEAPSSTSSLCSTFSSTLANRITNKIQGSIRPATHALTNMCIDKMLQGVTKIVEEQEKDFCVEREMYYQANNMGNESRQKRKRRGNKEENYQQSSVHEKEMSSGNNQSPNNESVNYAADPISLANKEMAERVLAGEQAGIAELGAASAELKQPIAVYNEHGRCMEILGRAHKGHILKVQHYPSVGGLSGHWVPYGTEATADFSGSSNCAYDALACQTDKVKSGAELREKVASRLASSKHTPTLCEAVQRLATHNPRDLRRGGGMSTALHFTQYYDPHSDYNQCYLESSNRDYASLKEELKEATNTGNQVQKKSLETQCREMEVDAFNAREERNAKAVGYVLQFGVGVTASYFAGPLAGTAAFSVAGVGFDEDVRHNIKSGNLGGALDASSYHLPLLGSGRRAWDSWQVGNYGDAVWHASLSGFEAVSLHAIGRVWGSEFRPVRNAYKLAKAGKIHGDTYKTYLHKPDRELRKATRSLNIYTKVF
ncbi:MAG: hypothetical protein MUC61_03265 [Amoebophilaceae bacterium]|nr:hypothetical protein [Amoebophilaceae bacterium]